MVYFMSLPFFFFLILAFSSWISEAKMHRKHKEEKVLRTEAKGFTCGVTFPTGGFRYKVCNELQKLDSQGVIGGYNLNQAKNSNNKWCKYDASKTDSSNNFVYLEIRLRVEFDSSHYTSADKSKYKDFVVKSLMKYVSNKVVSGKRIALTVAINSNNIFHWGHGMSFKVVDDSSTIMKAGEMVGARKASFNAEFLVGAGVYSYIPREKLNDPTRADDIIETISHEICHSIMSLKSKLWSLTHKGTSTVGQEAIPGKPADNDICTYAPTASGGKRFLESDLMWLVVSCGNDALFSLASAEGTFTTPGAFDTTNGADGVDTRPADPALAM